MKTRLILILSATLAYASLSQAVTLIEAGRSRAVILVDVGDLTAEQRKVMDETARWLVESLRQASGATLAVGNRPTDQPTVLLTTATAQPRAAERLKLRADKFDAYAIETTADRVTLIGSNVYSLRHAVAHLLRDQGFRYYAPSPRWHIVPRKADVKVELNVTAAPDIGTRKIWYAYGQPDKDLMANYERWVMGNRLSGHAPLHTGHSYGNIITRNAAEFDKHPEYYAMNEAGERETNRGPNASKFCFSNPGLQELVARDRIRLLGEMKKADPLANMVSVDPSDGQGTCHCKDCLALGTTTDRVFHLANHVARKLRAEHPDGWVGLYAYSSHRLPPTIKVEPNVYVQVALAFNQTEFTLPELVGHWSEKVSAVGLREYYGVEAWDWGLPGQMRGGKPAYHKEWIPFYAARKANAINAETNANWGGQALGLLIAAELMWDVKADAAAIEDRFFADCFGAAAPAMRDLQKKFDAGGPLQAGRLAPMFGDLEKAIALSDDPRVRARLADMAAYLVYADAYRKFQSVASRANRDDAYYDALKPLMNYAWRIRSRDVVHYYALARRLCNGLPLQDKRLDFYMNRKDGKPVWMEGDALDDEQILKLFHERFDALKKDTDRHAHYTRSFQAVRPAGPDHGASRLLAAPKEAGYSEFRGKLTGYLIGAEGLKVAIGIKAEKRPVTLTVYSRGDDELQKKQVTDVNDFTTIEVVLPKAGEYRFVIEGDHRLRVSPEAPIVYEASAPSPAWVEYCGPHYFYVPRGVRRIFVEATPRLSVHAPGVAKRIDVTPADRMKGEGQSVIEVPEGADGQVWSTDPNTRGRVSFLNIPPLLSLNRGKVFVPREVAETDGLTTAPAPPR